MEISPDVVAGWIIKIAVAAIILAVGLFIAGWVAGVIRKGVEKNAKVDDTLGAFFASLARYAIIAMAVVTALQSAGVPATSFAAVLGATALAIGLALQGTLGNIAAGVMIILFRPYKIGQFVEVAGKSGTVKNITIFVTELATVDNVQITIPNGQAWGDLITNYSANDTRRVDITFGISYDDDISQAIDVICGVVKADARFLDAPAEPWVRVVNLGDSSVDLQLRAWAKASDYWEAKFATIRSVKEGFDKAGIEIPYPHQVNVRKEAATG